MYCIRIILVDGDCKIINKREGIIIMYNGLNVSMYNFKMITDDDI